MSKKPTSQVVGKIYSTVNYDMFKLRKDNRDIKEFNVSLKMESIVSMGQITSILIDPDGYVIDGQNRLEACKRLGIPVKYEVIEKSISTTDIAEIQNTSVKWNTGDYLKSFSADNNPDYLLYAKFKKSFPEISHSIAVMLLRNDIHRNKEHERSFHEGTFKVADYQKAVRIASRLRELSQFYKGTSKRGFALAFTKMSEHQEFDYDRLLRKMPKRCKDIMDFSRQEDYLTTLENIYNWRESKKVYFQK